MRSAGYSAHELAAIFGRELIEKFEASAAQVDELFMEKRADYESMRASGYSPHELAEIFGQALIERFETDAAPADPHYEEKRADYESMRESGSTPEELAEIFGQALVNSFEQVAANAPDTPPSNILHSSISSLSSEQYEKLRAEFFNLRASGFGQQELLRKFGQILIERFEADWDSNSAEILSSGLLELSNATKAAVQTGSEINTSLERSAAESHQLADHQIVITAPHSQQEANRLAEEWQAMQRGSLEEQAAWLEQTAASFEAGSEEAKRWAEALRGVNLRRINEELNSLGDTFKVTGNYAAKDNRTQAQIHAADEKALRQRREALERLKAAPDVDAATLKAINAKIKETDRQIRGLRQSMSEAAAAAQRSVANLKPLGQKAAKGSGVGAQHALKRLEKAYVLMARRAERQASRGDTQGMERTVAAMRRHAAQQERLTGYTGRAAGRMRSVEANLQSIAKGTSAQDRGLTAQQRQQNKVLQSLGMQRRYNARQERAGNRAAKAKEQEAKANERNARQATRDTQRAKPKTQARQIQELTNKLQEANKSLAEQKAEVVRLNAAIQELAGAAREGASAARGCASAAAGAVAGLRREVKALQRAVERLRKK